MANEVNNHIKEILIECEKLDIKLLQLALADGSDEEIECAISSCAITVKLLAEKVLAGKIFSNSGYDLLQR